jgi:hypothetical protein
MATGFLDSPGGVMAPADVHDAGVDAWTRVAGIHPKSVIVGGPGHPDDINRLPYNVDHARGRIVTNDVGKIGPAGGPGVGLLDDWRDIFNFQHSPIPWLLLASLAIVGLMQFRLQARVAGRRGPRASLALG